MTKMCENCGYVAEFADQWQTRHAAPVADPEANRHFWCGPLRPYVLDRNRPLSHGALAPGAKP
jgi:hypothetical protein